MLYNLGAEILSAKRRIENLKQKENIDLIMKFLDQLYAEGLSKHRVLKYAKHLKVLSEKMGKSFLNIDEDDIRAFLSNLEQSEYTEYTKIDYRIVLKRFFRFLGKNELVKDIKTTLRGNRKKLPGELLTEAEVESMIQSAKHPRDKAIIGLLYEGGLRIGELASLKMRNVQFNDNGAVIKVHGKTGERRVLIVMFASLLAKWIEMHPRRDEKDAFLWVNLSTNYKKEGITYHAIRQNLRRIGAMAGVEKKITPHVFRHSRATHLARHLTEAEMNVYFGWVQGSNMPGIYVHLSGRDVDDKILQIHGLKPKDKDKENKMKPIECPRCKYINAPVSRYCGRCGTVLDEEERIKLEIQSRQVSKDFPDLSIEDPGLLEEMKKFRELLELFERYPELFRTMMAMAEGK